MSIFSFPAHIYAHFAHKNYKKVTEYFQCGYKTKTKLKHRTHYAIFQNRRICASCPILWLGTLCGLCILPYIYGLWFVFVGVAVQVVLCGLGLHGHLGCESVSVFDGFVYL